MRTTVTLDPDAEQIVRDHMRARSVSSTQALNEVIRAGSRAQAKPRRFRTRTSAMGEPPVTPDRALQIAGDLEDDELLRAQRADS